MLCGLGLNIVTITFKDVVLIFIKNNKKRDTYTTKRDSNVFIQGINIILSFT